VKKNPIDRRNVTTAAALTMNPLTNTRNITKLSQRELQQGDGKTSWHDEYKGSAWVFVGGLPYDLSEGDIISVFSQYGEIVNINLCRDKVTGKSKGFAFVCYEDQRSTTLAVDNFNGIKILTRTIRVDHVKDYKPPKDSDKLDDITRALREQGCGPSTNVPDPEPDDDFVLPLPDGEIPESSLKRIKYEPNSDSDHKRKAKKIKKSKSKKKKDHKKSSKSRRRSKDRIPSSSSSSSESDPREAKRTKSYKRSSPSESDCREAKRRSNYRR